MFACCGDGAHESDRLLGIGRAPGGGAPCSTAPGNDYVGNNSPLTIHGVPNLSISMPKVFAQ